MSSPGLRRRDRVVGENPAGAPPFGPVDGCPHCENVDVRSDESSEQLVFRCHECGTRWRYALGYLSIL